MIKKIILLIALTTSMFATNKISIHYNADNNDISITPLDANIIDENEQDWIGVYKKDDSNDWENVVQWAWVKDLYSVNYEEEGVEEKEKKILTLSSVPKGSYELRYFLNNSFDTYHSQSFKVLDDEAFNDHIEIISQTDANLTFNASHMGSESWIGIYKKGDSNDWKNVKEWSWIKYDEITLNINNLASGIYEARLFYNNSYDLEAKVQFIKESDNQANIEISSHRYFEINFNSTFAGEKSWIGIYKKGDSNDWENVKKWRWIYGSSTKLYIHDLENGIYEARLFYYNSYDVEDKVEFKVDDQNINAQFLKNIENRHGSIIDMSEEYYYYTIYRQVDNHIIALSSFRKHSLNFVTYYTLEGNKLVFQKELKKYRGTFVQQKLKEIEKIGDNLLVKIKKYSSRSSELGVYLFNIKSGEVNAGKSLDVSSGGYHYVLTNEGIVTIINKSSGALYTKEFPVKFFLQLVGRYTVAGVYIKDNELINYSSYVGPGSKSSISIIFDITDPINIVLKKIVEEEDGIEIGEELF